MTECHTVVGIVRETLPDQKARVLFQKVSACAGCSSAAGCLGSSEGGEVLLCADNEPRALPGDRVRIMMTASALLVASAVLYAIPTVFMIAGCLAGYGFGLSSPIEADALSATGAALGLVFGLLLSHVVGKRVTRKMDFNPRIVEILSPGS